MNSDALTEIACPNCLAPMELHGRPQHITCDACGSHFLLEGHICPACYTYHREARAICRQCGEALTRVCQKCQAVKWAGDEYCHTCGAALDIFAMLQKVDAKSRAARLAERQTQIRQLKEEEEKASQRRMAELLAVEEERQAELARQTAVSRRRDQQILTAVGVGLLVFVLVILAVALL